MDIDRIVDAILTDSLALTWNFTFGLLLGRNGKARYSWERQ